MKRRRILLIFCVVVITFICVIRVNSRFDSLARYQYDDEHARELIKKHLSDKNIDYIIEFSIDPNYFIDFIEYDDFNIYHCDVYNYVKDHYWYLDSEYVVNFSERVIKYKSDNTIDFLAQYRTYSSEEILYYLENNHSASLIERPDEYNLMLEDKYFSTYSPRDLAFNGSFSLRYDAITKYNEMIEYLETKMNVKDTKVKIKNAYLSFESLEKLNNKSAKPGYNVHQLGASIDLDLSNSIFNENNIDVLNNALAMFGFIKEDCPLSDFHIRYIAVEYVNE